MRTPLHTVTSLDEVQAAAPPASAPGRRGVAFTSLDDVQVASPCTANWDAMAGDDRRRFCPQCHQNVYNISAMTREQALSLLRERERTPCVRFFRRRDGTILTADCPIGIRQIAGHAWGWTAMTWAALIAFGLGLLGWAVGRPRATMGACGTSSNSRQGVTLGDMGRPAPRDRQRTPARKGGDEPGRRRRGSPSAVTGPAPTRGWITRHSRGRSAGRPDSVSPSARRDAYAR
jgi:hypothetical protein